MRWLTQKLQILLLAVGLCVAFKIFSWIDPTDCAALRQQIFPPCLLFVLLETFSLILALHWSIYQAPPIPRWFIYFTYFNDPLFYPIFIALVIQGFRGFFNSESCQEIWTLKKDLKPAEELLIVFLFGTLIPNIKREKWDYLWENFEMREPRERFSSQNRRRFKVEDLRRSVGRFPEDVEKLRRGGFLRFCSKKRDASHFVTCSICRVDYWFGDKIVTLPKCKHVFHHKCVSEWLLSSPICPLCRKGVRNGL